MSATAETVFLFEEPHRLENYDLLVVQLRSFLRRLSKTLDQRANARLGVESGNFWKLGNDTLPVTPQLVEEVCQAIVTQLGSQEIDQVLDTAVNEHIFDVLQKKFQEFGYSHRAR